MAPEREETRRIEIDTTGADSVFDDAWAEETPDSQGGAGERESLVSAEALSPASAGELAEKTERIRRIIEDLAREESEEEAAHSAQEEAAKKENINKIIDRLEGLRQRDGIVSADDNKGDLNNWVIIRINKPEGQVVLRAPKDENTDVDLVMTIRVTENTFLEEDGPGENILTGVLAGYRIVATEEVPRDPNLFKRFLERKQDQRQELNFQKEESRLEDKNQQPPTPLSQPDFSSFGRYKGAEQGRGGGPLSGFNLRQILNEAKLKVTLTSEVSSLPASVFGGRGEEGQKEDIEIVARRQAGYTEIAGIESDTPIREAIIAITEMLVSKNRVESRLKPEQEQEIEERVQILMVRTGLGYQDLWAIIKNQEAWILEEAKRREGAGRSRRKELAKAGARVVGYGAIGMGLSFLSGGLAAGGVLALRLADRAFTERQRSARIAKEEEKIKIKLTSRDGNNQLREDFLLGFAAQLAMAEQARIDRDAYVNGALDDIAENSELFSDVFDSARVLSTIDDITRSTRQELESRFSPGKLLPKPPQWLARAADFFHGSDSRERLVSTAVYGVAGLAARELPIIRNILTGLAGYRAGDLLAQRRPERLLTAEDLNEGNLSQARAQLLDDNFRKQRPAQYQVLKERVDQLTQIIIERSESAIGLLEDLEDDELSPVPESVEEATRRSLSLEVGRRQEKKRKEKVQRVAVKAGLAALGAVAPNILSGITHAFYPAETGPAVTVHAPGEQGDTTAISEAPKSDTRLETEVSAETAPRGISTEIPVAKTPEAPVSGGAEAVAAAPALETAPAASAGAESGAPAAISEAAGSRGGEGAPDLLEQFKSGHKLLEATGADISEADGKLQVIYDIGHGKDFPTLDQTLRRVVVQEFNVGEDNQFSALEAAKAENVLANIRRLLEGHGVAGFKPEQLTGVAHYEDGQLVIEDYGRFQSKVLEPLFERADKVISTESEALAYVNRTSLSRWQEMFDQRESAGSGEATVKVEDFGRDNQVQRAISRMTERAKAEEVARHAKEVVAVSPAGGAAESVRDIELDRETLNQLEQSLRLDGDSVAKDLIKSVSGYSVEDGSIISGSPLDRLIRNPALGETLQVENRLDSSQARVFDELIKNFGPEKDRIIIDALRATKLTDWAPAQELALAKAIIEPYQPEHFRALFGSELVRLETRIDQTSNGFVFKRLGGLGGKFEIDFAQGKIKVGGLLRGVRTFDLSQIDAAVQELKDKMLKK